eukprot:maker-scaffold_27-snap-gene-2.56-mRNA-1 protein AED:0.17 eAED:0.17 QI:0/0/0/1/1/1/2/0/1327
MVWQERRTLDGMAFYIETETEEVSWQKPEALMSAEEKQASEGEWVWVPHPVDMWQAGKVVKKDDDGTTHVALDDGSLMKVPATGEMQGPETGGRKQVVPLWSLNKNNLRFLEDDLVMLDPVNEAFIINNLARRYEKKQIYTWVGAAKSVLVSVNPYQNLPLYGDDQIDLHRNKPADQPIGPHVFEVANESYDSMAFDRRNQSILISGESGAGKTEATKQCLKYLAAVAGSDSNVEEKILVANPLLEAFGNAKTIRNINSSRFGKWMEVYFDRTSAKMKGSRIVNYLLERSRIVHQQANERNFHIFYQLTKSDEACEKLNLLKPSAYNYMNQSQCVDVPQIDDSKEFADVKEAMDKLEFTKEEQNAIFELTAAVLWLGNVQFDAKLHKGSVEGSSIAAGEAIKNVSNLLEISEEALAQILCYRTIKPRGGADKAVIPLSKADARAACDSLAMGIYGKLFTWLVVRVNDSLGEADGRILGILDIFGFEIFENNSFEQLCINYANEKLQMLFNETTFKEEEKLYRAEGVDYTPIKFIDNEEVLEVIEKKPNGILPALDDECILPEGNDQKFMNKIEDVHTAKSCFETDPKRRFDNKLSFEITHYAGVVKYDASAFMVKNIDTVYDDMYEAMMGSSKDLLKTIFDSADRKIKTLSNQFRGQLNTLMDTLHKTDSRFIRCIKPNEHMNPSDFVAANCVEQLRYSGVFEAVDIRKTGYPFRFTHKKFVYRYSCINHKYKYKTKVSEENYADRVKEILDVSKQNFSEVKIGNSMALYKANEYKLLKLLRSLAMERLIPMAQASIKGGVTRHYTSILLENTREIQKYINKADDFEGLSKAIEKADLKNSFEPEQLKLFNTKPNNLAVAGQLKLELAAWLELEKKMNTIIEKCESNQKPDPYYDSLKLLDTQVVETMKAQSEKEKASKPKKDGRLTYKKPKLTISQRQAHRKIKEYIHQCVLGQLDARVDKAIDTFNRKEIIASLEKAQELGHQTKRITEAKQLLNKMKILDEDCQRAVACVSNVMLKEALENAKALKQSNDYITAAKKMYELDNKSFVQAEYEKAKEVGDKGRETHREIRLLEFKYDEIDVNQYTLEKMVQYRDQEEFAKAKGLTGMFSRQKIAESMKVWSDKPMPTSLSKPTFELKAETDGEPELKAQVKTFKAMAKDNFKDILVAMEIKVDKKLSANEAAKKILSRGIEAYRKMDEEVLKELYIQVIKQATNADEANKTKALELLSIMLQMFAPSPKAYQPDVSLPAIFDDAIVVWINKNVPENERRKYISALHNTKYSPKPDRATDPAMLKNQFKEMTGKYSLDSEADSGPEEKNVGLYFKK